MSFQAYRDAVMAFLAMTMQHSQDGFQDFVKTIDGEHLRDQYDFIIIGGGSSGSALANRLSEVREWQILLLEAGGQENYFTRTPAVYGALPTTKNDWNYTTTVQRHACKATQGRCTYPRGRLLGGSSGTNAMIYTRGYKIDYDNWGQSNCGWSFRDVEPYFIQLEGYRIPGVSGRGRDGPLTVSYAPFKTRLREEFINAGLSKGLKNESCPDHEEDCIYFTESTIREGRRCSASTAYLESISARRNNLHILTFAHVNKISIVNRSAKGVEVLYDGKILRIKARREIILSAGAINSPKILMLSGIGPKEHLDSLNINVLRNLPVGDNLQDHNRVPLIFQVRNRTVPNTDNLANKTVQRQYIEHQMGPFSYSGIEALGFVRRGVINRITRRPPNIQYHMTTLMGQKQYLVAISTTVLRPKSRGTIRLNSKHPTDNPLINPNYYSDNADKKLTIEGLLFSNELIKTRPLTSFGATLYKKLHPFCSDRTDLNRYLNCVVEYYTFTNYHPVGTVKMGPIRDKGVVNWDLKIHGIENLRVIDASIAPTLISMNTNAMAIMIGEKGADIIKAAHGKPTHHKLQKC